MRRSQSVSAAFDLIAQVGLEGLTMRDVAARVGVTHATLHYYFPSKDDLIRAVLEYVIGQRLVWLAPEAESGTAAQRLRALLSGLNQQTEEEPAHVVVLNELIRHANRDERSRALLEPWHQGWHAFLVELVMSGKRDGSFRSDLDADATASMIVLMSMGRRLGASMAPAVDEAMLSHIDRLLSPKG